MLFHDQMGLEALFATDSADQIADHHGTKKASSLTV